MQRYKVIDNTGHIVRSFPTYIQASNFKVYCNRQDWIIKELYQQLKKVNEQTSKVTLVTQIARVTVYFK